jgi:Tfp pilus assembly protein PilF
LRALQTFSTALSLDDTYYRTHQLIGDVHSVRKEWSEAAVAYEKAVERNRRSAAAAAGLWYVRAHLDKPPDSPPLTRPE